jgi:hypothetical protein
MSFGRRLRLYLLGFLLGMGLVVFFFNDRLSLLTSWLPNDRVLLRLQMTEALYADSALCHLDCFSLDTADVSLVKKEGDVQFGLSETHETPMIYVVDKRINDRLVRMHFLATDSSSSLIQVEVPNDRINCDCDSTSAASFPAE